MTTAGNLEHATVLARGPRRSGTASGEAHLAELRARLLTAPRPGWRRPPDDKVLAG
ncbi:MAG: hypothetical protein IPL61_18700 [Myxococcales bacterium]|nr:hypothetical protein [Myxococcales bacterium]